MNKVILIGGDHHNGLGLARSFGINGIRPYGIIVKKGGKKSFAGISRYWAKTWVINDNSILLDLLIDKFSNEQEKPVIIPWSDSEAAYIDQNLNVLKKYFIVPSLNQSQGAIVNMMDKDRQIDFMKKYGLPMAKSWIIPLSGDYNITEISYPCICKPVSSYEGQKSDIKKCSDKEALSQYLSELSGKGYNRILVQQYIDFDKELEFVGSFSDNPSYIISENIRSWPAVGGTNSFFRIIDNDNVKQVCKNILNALRKEKYFGMFDIELFKVSDTIFVNEINWRNSGNSFICLCSGVHWAVDWYLDAIGQDTSNRKHNSDDTNVYCMNEATDPRHVVFEKLKLRDWFSDFRKTKGFALWDKKDLKPTFTQYIHLVKELINNKNK